MSTVESAMGDHPSGGLTCYGRLLTVSPNSVSPLKSTSYGRPPFFKDNFSCTLACLGVVPITGSIVHHLTDFSPLLNFILD